MAKKELRYVCNNCLESFLTWSGKCPNCGQWNSIEEKIELNKDSKIKGHLIESTKLDKINLNSENERIVLQEAQINNVFGGGIVKGSVTLLAGEPGIGKSTLLLGLADLVDPKYRILYVSAEESLSQIYLRSKRMNISNISLNLASNNSTDDIISTILTKEYDLVIIDSIQTIQLSEISSASGSVSQITNSSNFIIEASKKTNTAVILVGHVTKEGNIAGPKLLEHLVDVVLQFEGDKFGNFKILKALKNRFGSVNEAAIYEMSDKGLKIALNPSKELLRERLISDGSIVHATLEGNQAMLVEIQALVNTTKFGYPKRTASGIDINRLNMLIAILERRTKLNLSNKDIYINVVGGLSLKDPSSDLAVSMAIASAAAKRKLNRDLIVIGEVGLSGEIRHVPFIKKRFDEAMNMSFEGMIGPKTRETNSKSYFSVVDLKTCLNTYLK